MPMTKPGSVCVCGGGGRGGVIRFGSGCGGHDLILMVFGSTTTYAVCVNKSSNSVQHKYSPIVCVNISSNSVQHQYSPIVCVNKSSNSVQHNVFPSILCE